MRILSRYCSGVEIIRGTADHTGTTKKHEVEKTGENDNHESGTR